VYLPNGELFTDGDFATLVDKAFPRLDDKGYVMELASELGATTDDDCERYTFTIEQMLRFAALYVARGRSKN
jgi:hypothetical protein